MAEKPQDQKELEKAEKNEATKNRRQMKNSARQFSIDRNSSEFPCDHEELKHFNNDAEVAALLACEMRYEKM